MNSETKTILNRLDRLERILLMIVPYRRLPVDLQKHAAELQGLVVKPDTGDTRLDYVLKDYRRLCELDGVKRNTAKWPKSIIQDTYDAVVNGEKNMPIVPLSALVNRLSARLAFQPVPGEVSARDNVMKAIGESGLMVLTLHEAGLLHGGKVQVVSTENGFKGLNAPAVEEEEEEEEEPILTPDEPEETIQKDLDRMKAAREAKKEEARARWGAKEEHEEEPVVVKAKKKEVTFDWSSINKEEVTYEESEVAQGVALFRQEDNDDDVVEDDEDEEETLTTITDPVDDGWGPDELETYNPVREQFEAEAEAAWQREQEALERGDLVLVDGIPVARKSTLKNK